MSDNEGSLKPVQFYFFLFVIFLFLCLAHITAISNVEIFLSKVPLSLSYQTIPVLFNFFSYYIIIPLLVVFFHAVTFYTLRQFIELQKIHNDISPLYFLNFILLKAKGNNSQSRTGKNQIINPMLSAVILIALFFLPTVILVGFFIKYLIYQSPLLSGVQLLILIIDYIVIVIFGDDIFVEIRRFIRSNKTSKPLYFVFRFITLPIIVLSYLMTNFLVIAPIRIFLLYIIGGRITINRGDFAHRIIHFKFQTTITLIAIFIYALFVYFLIMTPDLIIKTRLSEYFPKIKIKGYAENISSNPTMANRNYLLLNLNNLTIEHTDFSESDFSGSVIRNVRFLNCSFHSTLLKSNFFENVDFIDSDFTSSSFDPLQIDGCRFINCNFNHLAIKGLVGKEIVFDSSSFRQGSLHFNYLNDCSFRFCDMEGIDLSFNQFDRNDFSGVLINNANMQYNSMRRTKWDGSNLCKSTIVRSEFHRSSFKGIDLRMTRFYGCFAPESNFDLCILLNHKSKDEFKYNPYYGSFFDASRGTVYLDDYFYGKYKAFIPDLDEKFFTQNITDSILKPIDAIEVKPKLDQLFDEVNLKYTTDTLNQAVKPYVNSNQLLQKIQDAKETINKLIVNSRKNILMYNSNSIHYKPFPNSKFTVWTQSDTTFALKRKDFLAKNPEFKKSLTPYCITIQNNIFSDVFQMEIED
jgi:uncharacterized protein YjbI with pentapeptide repeats